VLDVYLELLEAGGLADVAGRVVGDAVLAAHGVVVVAAAHDVAHAPERAHTHTHAHAHTHTHTHTHTETDEQIEIQHRQESPSLVS